MYVCLCAFVCVCVMYLYVCSTCVRVRVRVYTRTYVYTQFVKKKRVQYSSLYVFVVVRHFGVYVIFESEIRHF